MNICCPLLCYRKCLAFVVIPVLEKEVEDFKNLWNSHATRCNRKSGVPHGIPNDLYVMSMESGETQPFILLAMAMIRYCTFNLDQLCPLDVDVWEHFMMKSSCIPSFYDENFQYIASSFLLQYGLSQDLLTTSNILDAYNYLVEYFCT